MTETIVALATPPGKSAIAALRISGPAVPEICKTVLPGFKMKPRLASLINNHIAIFFPAPNSYTGEDVLELFPHGNPFIIRKLIEEICQVKGVRPANRGEFTERAFLNGKMDLTQAEAVGDILSAQNAKTLANAQKLLKGEISDEIKKLAETIKQISATLELDVDFAENVGGVESGEWRVESVLEQLQSLRKRFKVAQNELPRAVLFGAPNAGKSSLINALLKEDRLLVSEAPGTTRDFVEVPLSLPSGDILLIDTAGLASEAQSKIDTQAMQKTKEILNKANLKILVIDGSIPLPAEFAEWEKTADMIVGTHGDLHCCRGKKSFAPTAMQTSAATNFGIKELRDALDNIFFPKEESEEAWITSERQISCIKKAEECVQRAMQSGAVELAAFEMRDARNALCSVTGEISDESILNSIFSSYCIGK
ncbi:MAG: tRNA uridine-5-carboxymethylaminomethyl(34) synthesis GTPase MnmE [Fibromonadales bacterium]|nr:tRNA uridine-5-carboxymethylaminomethyl(34) synthesis GTPase MnmE [Fibromonadales bacterium]